MPPPNPRQTLPPQKIRPSMPSAGAAGLPSAVSRGAPSGRAPSGMGLSSSSAAPNPALLARLHDKKAELEELKELNELSAQLAGQMQSLEEKLGTLSSGTEAVALVLGNWGNVLRAVGLAGAAVPRPKDGGQSTQERPLPQPLVRIPVAEMQQMRAKEGGE